MLAGFPFTAHTQAGAGIHTGRDAHHDLAAFFHDALALAAGAGLFDDLTGPLAGGAGHGDLEEALGMAHLAGAVALGAGLGLAARGGAAAGAVGAGHVLGQGQGYLVACGGLLERDFQVVAQVGALHGAGTACAAGGSKAEKVAEDIAEVGEDIFVAGKARTAHAALHAGMTEAVIAGALFGVAQHVIGLGGFLELLFGFGITGVVVGMVAHGQLAVGFFDLLFAGVAFHPQNFVIVSLYHDL